MFLKRIELQGFKSFANKTVIQFDHDITGIVGPNGCGKSNINDAIRWVLGEQSVKSLRSGSNMSDIIFSGSEQKKRVNIARVTLVFDNATKILDTPFEEVEITRQIQRLNNESNYLINNTPCRLKDIQELIMDTGLGRDSLSIITQGNISSFADAKPEERRALFEEAAGVAKYKKRKQVSLSKLERTKANLDRLQDILDELERQIKPLEKQAEKARTYIQYRDELAEIEVSVLVAEIESLNEEIKSLKQAIFQSNTYYSSLVSHIDQNEEKINQLRKERNRIDQKIQELQLDYTKLMEESVQLEKRKVELDEKRKYTLRLADEKERKQTLLAMKSEAEYEYQNRKERLNGLNHALLQAKKEQDVLSKKINSIQFEINQTLSVFHRVENREQVLRSMMNDPYQRQSGVGAILQAKKSLYGIEGTVAQLFLAKNEYAQAVSNALGASIYQIVTLDEKSAREAINYLKRNRSGRATFLPMSVCKPRIPTNAQKLIAQSLDGVLGWANSFVECEPRYKNVRDRLLGNILIADSLETANEAAKRLNYTLKIVTKEGDIVHSGGAMSGGRSRSSSTPITMQEELKAIQNQVKEQKNRLNDLQNKKESLEKELDQKQEQVVSIQVEQAKLENIVLVKKEKYESILDELNRFVPDFGSESLNLEDDLVVQISSLHSKIDDIARFLTLNQTSRVSLGKEMENLETQIRKDRREMNVRLEQVHQSEMKLTKAQTEQSHNLDRLNAEYQMTFEYAQTKRQFIELVQAKARVQELRKRIRSLGNVNLDAPAEFEESSQRYEFLLKQKNDLLKASKQILDAIDEMDQTMIQSFTEMFNKINQELDGVFKAMFGGGRAQLSMIDPDDVLNTGIDIDVQPPGKLIKNIQSFSGGEKALIAISVLFAILKARLIPLCIFDEVEAALDQSNVERFAKYLKHFRNQSQFIVVTHRPGTMEQCDVLYGVTMQQDGVSQILKVLLKDALSYMDQ